VAFHNDSVNNENKIPKRDQQAVENFLYRIIFEDEFGYTLFGNKPLTFHGYSTSHNKYQLDLRDSFYYQLISLVNFSNKKSFQEALTTSKYFNLGSDNDFVFIFEYDLSDHTYYIVFVNKKAFKETVESNLASFQKKFGNLSPEMILKKFELERYAFFKELYKDELLLGIVLGYGSHNTELFVRRNHLLNLFNTISNHSNEISHPNSSFASLEAELENLDKIFASYDDNYTPPLDVVMPVSFGRDKKDEKTIQLTSHYNEVRDKLTQIHALPNHGMELILSKLNLK
jgi:hypothetical protein